MNGMKKQARTEPHARFWPEPRSADWTPSRAVRWRAPAPGQNATTGPAPILVVPSRGPDRSYCKLTFPCSWLQERDPDHGRTMFKTGFS